MTHKTHEFDQADVLTALEQARHPLSLAELTRKLGLRSAQRRQLKKTLVKLRNRGRVAEVHGGRYMPSAKKKQQEVRRKSAAVAALAPPTAGLSHGTVRGKLVTHRDGYGFVIPEQPIPGIEGDVFVPPNAMGDAMHGDRVRVRLQPGGRGGRGGRVRRSGRMEGRIVAVDKRAHPTVVGQFHFGDQHNYVTPYEQRLLREIVIARGDEVPPGYHGKRKDLDEAVVNVEITRYPSGGGAPRGRVVELLGHPGEFGLDVEIMIRKYHLPCLFEDDVLTEARSVPQEVDRAELVYREDFRHLPIVTIDGEDAKDFDDAIHVERLPNGNYLLQVHIADVAHYVRPGAALDREARLRGTSVYFPDRAVPMLPVELSNGICSLNPQVDRLALSCLMEIDPQGEVVNYRFAESVIRSAERLTYTAVNAALEGDAATRARYPALLPEFEKMRDLALILNAKRERRGSIDFDLPEPIIRFDERGQMIGITRSERNIANRLIEEFMLAANETVAGFLEGRGVASLHRAHEKPDPKKVLEFEEIAASFGYSLGIADQVVHSVRVRERPSRSSGRQRPRQVEIPERLEVSPRHYQRLTVKIAGRPEERILSYLMLRSLKQARYTEENLGHFALATSHYTHFTSPIRRYPDLIIHRLLKWTLLDLRAEREGLPPRAAAEKHAAKPHGRSKVEQPRGPIALDELRTIATETSETERRAADAERELIDLKKLDFMQQHLGDEFDGLVINCARFGFWVELLDLFVEGLVPLETLDPDADYYYRETTRTIAPGRRSRVSGAPAFHLGDRLRVRVDRIDRMARQIQFSVTGKTVAAQ